MLRDPPLSVCEQLLLHNRIGSFTISNPAPVATKLTFTQQPSSGTTGVALGTQPGRSDR
jgi:hypothetical protein